MSCGLTRRKLKRMVTAQRNSEHHRAAQLKSKAAIGAWKSWCIQARGENNWQLRIAGPVAAVCDRRYCLKGILDAHGAPLEPYQFLIQPATSLALMPPAVLQRSKVGLYPPLPVEAILVEYPEEFPNGSGMAITIA